MGILGSHTSRQILVQSLHTPQYIDSYVQCIFDYRPRVFYMNFNGVYSDHLSSNEPTNAIQSNFGIQESQVT